MIHHNHKHSGLRSSASPSHTLREFITFRIGFRDDTEINRLLFPVTTRMLAGLDFLSFPSQFGCAFNDTALFFLPHETRSSKGTAKSLNPCFLWSEVDRAPRRKHKSCRFGDSLALYLSIESGTEITCGFGSTWWGRRSLSEGFWPRRPPNSNYSSGICSYFFKKVRICICWRRTRSNFSSLARFQVWQFLCLICH